MLELIKNNPFRILGVYANASIKDITSNKSKFIAYAKVNKSITLPSDCVSRLGEVDRSEQKVLSAGHEITLPDSKMRYALFWFVNDGPIADVALANIQEGSYMNTIKAIDILYKKPSFSSWVNLSTLSIMQGDVENTISSMLRLVTNQSYCLQFSSSICGDNYLGGKNLDYAVVDGIIIPHLKENFVIDEILADEHKKQILRDAMKFYAEQAKNQLSFKDKCDITSQLDEFGEDDEGTELELDMVITADQLKTVVAPIFQKAIDICKTLIARNNLTGKLDTLILVGGPTYSPVLRQMLREQITPNVDTSIDPMTAVARGAALYASGIDCESTVEVASGTIALEVNYESNSVETLEFVTVKLLPNDCTGTVPSKLYVELTRGDKAWSSGKVEINSIGDVIECQLVEGKTNSFSIVAYDETGASLPCYPNEINIIQGTKIGNAVLPYHIGIEVRDTDLHKDVFMPLTGLEKNQQIPAVGVRNGLKTPKQIRPGNINDKLVIPIYLGEHNVEGSSAIYNDHVFDVVITGDDVPALIPANSDIDITIKVDRSQLLRLEATFPVIGETIEKDIEIGQRSVDEQRDELMSRYREAMSKLEGLKTDGIATSNELQEAESLMNDVSSRIDNEKSSDDGMMHLLADLRRAFLAMERVEKNHEWDTIEKELREEFEKLEMANNELGHKYDNEVSALRKQTDEAIRQKDVQYGRKVLSDIRQVFVIVTMIYQLIGFVRHHSHTFNMHNWTDPGRARALLNQAMAMVQSDPSVEKLHPLVCDIIALLPDGDKIKI